MTLEKMQAAKIAAMKNNDMNTKNVLSSMIDACQKAAITPKGRVEITELLVDETLIKYQKTIQEMIDTCPADRVELLEKYKAEMEVVKVYAPQLISDPTEITQMIVDAVNGEYEFTKANKGKIMKIIAPIFKGKADMKTVGMVLGEMLI